jgi:hypothetical protein
LTAHLSNSIEQEYRMENSVLPDKAVWHGDFAACHALHDLAENFTSWAVQFLGQLALKLFLQLLSIKNK